VQLPLRPVVETGAPNAYASSPVYSVVQSWSIQDRPSLVLEVYPAHALFPGRSQVDNTPFREGTGWTRDDKNPTFDDFTKDGVSPDRNLFRPFAPLRYKNSSEDEVGRHPVMFEFQRGTKFTAD